MHRVDRATLVAATLAAGVVDAGEDARNVVDIYESILKELIRRNGPRGIYNKAFQEVAGEHQTRPPVRNLK